MQALDALWIATGEHVAMHGRSMCPEPVWNALRVRIDAGLARLWPRMCSHGAGLRNFVATYSHSLALLLGEADLNAILATGGKWLLALAQAKRVVQSSTVGKALFGFILEMLNADALAKVFQTAFTQFDPSDVSTASLQSLDAALADDLEQYKSATVLQQQRQVSIPWLGADVKIAVSGVAAEYSIRKTALIKQAALATDQSTLPRLPWESWLMRPLSSTKFTAPDAFTKPLVDARILACDIVSRFEITCVKDIEKLIGGARDLSSWGGRLGEMAMSHTEPLGWRFWKTPCGIIQLLVTVFAGISGCSPENVFFFAMGGIDTAV